MKKAFTEFKKWFTEVAELSAEIGESTAKRQESFAKPKKVFAEREKPLDCCKVLLLLQNTLPIVMKRWRHIERDGYHALDCQDDPGLFINDLWRRFPELVLGHYLVNTSYDSGSLALSEAELQDGWRMVGRLAHSPQICRTDQIPHDQFDEWLVFGQPIQVEEFDTMVNYPNFTPIDFEWEDKRERFWEQVVRLKPLHVIAENDGIYLLSRDHSLISRIMNAESDSLPNAAPPNC